MKNILKHIALIVSLLSLVAMSSCDKGFVEVNKDPISLTTIDPDYLFANAERNCVMSVVDYDASIIQQIITVQPGTLAGANFNYDIDINTRKIYNNLYGTPIKNLVAVLNMTKDDPDRQNLYNMSRILKAYAFMILVDTYGDVPYFDAGKAYTDAIYLPDFDDAATIYDDLLKELKEATQALDATKRIPTQELFYKGNIAKWKKFGNSLLLRAAMRLTKVNPTKAKDNVIIATNAANGGLIESVTDNTMIQYSTVYQNSISGTFQTSERGNYYLAKPFVDYLKNTNDPRLPLISVRYQFPANLYGSTGTEDTIPSHQIGMPFGYHGGNIVTEPNFPGIIGAGFAYSQPNRGSVAGLTCPAVLVSASQILLLKAEAVYIGFISGDAQSLYNAGVKAHMDQLPQYLSTSVVSASKQDAYLAANPYNPSTALAQINTQYWISSFLNWTEAWANFRRSGFPILVPNPFPGQDPLVVGGFIRRMTYPDREWSVSPDKLDVAVANQGPDNLVTRVFWDKP